MASRSLHRRRLAALLCLALSCRWLRAQVLGPRLAPLAPLEVRRIHAAVRSKALEAIAEGNLRAGRELELISALDLETVPWSQIPADFKDFWGLPGADGGIDSLALNLSIAVQAKDYQGYVPMARLATFYYLVRSEGSPLNNRVQQMVVATNESTRLPQNWEWSGAKHRRYTQDEIERWRELARNESAKDVMTEVMMDCMCEAGRDVLNDPEKVKDPVSFITAILNLKYKYDRFVKESFKESKDFQLALKQAFESFLNKDTRTAQYLSLYVDDQFRKGLKGMSSDADVDTALEQVVTVFRFLQDKDVFENFYKQHLSRRLLTGRSVSDEAERSMISKLKSECGHQYTSKLEGMFQDMKLSEDIMKQYKNSFTSPSMARGAGSAGPAGRPGTGLPALSSSIDLKVSVLTSGFWPGPPGAPCELPPEVQECCSRFETFYLAKHTGRKLFWQPQNGFADIKAQMPKTKHELNVTTYQMCILMLFNQQTTWTYQDLAVRTNIPLEELKRHLMSLYVNPKAKILVKLGDSEKKEPEESDQFTVNPQFESKLVRIKVPLVQLKSSETPAAGREGESGAVGSSDVPATVEEDRKHLVEAVVVRVMKSRKTLEHNQLVMEVTHHLTSRFQPSPTLIKQRIEKLIEREYLERSQGDRRVYNYLA